MSKSVRIKESGVQKSYNAVSYIETGTNEGGMNWIPEDQVAGYLDLEDLETEENGTFIPESSDAFDIVKVTAPKSVVGKLSNTFLRSAYFPNEESGEIEELEMPNNVLSAFYDLGPDPTTPFDYPWKEDVKKNAWNCIRKLHKGGEWISYSEAITYIGRNLYGDVPDRITQWMNELRYVDEEEEGSIGSISGSPIVIEGGNQRFGTGECMVRFPRTRTPILPNHISRDRENMLFCSNFTLACLRLMGNRFTTYENYLSSFPILGNEIKYTVRYKEYYQSYKYTDYSGNNRMYASAFLLKKQTQYMLYIVLCSPEPFTYTGERKTNYYGPERTYSISVAGKRVYRNVPFSFFNDYYLYNNYIHYGLPFSLNTDIGVIDEYYMATITETVDSISMDDLEDESIHSCLEEFPSNHKEIPYSAITNITAFAHAVSSMLLFGGIEIFFPTVEFITDGGEVISYKNETYITNGTNDAAEAGYRLNRVPGPFSVLYIDQETAANYGI